MLFQDKDKLRETVKRIKRKDPLLEEILERMPEDQEEEPLENEEDNKPNE